MLLPSRTFQAIWANEAYTNETVQNAIHQRLLKWYTLWFGPLFYIYILNVKKIFQPSIGLNLNHVLK